jgi:hypothetical protein
VSTREDDDGDRCDDRSEFEHDEALAEIDRCRAQPYDGEYVSSPVAVQDAQVPDGALDLLVPDLSGRWPEPRLLWQTDVWHLRHRTAVDLTSMGPREARWLLGVVKDLAVRLHAVAAHDEAVTTSSGLRRMLHAAGIPMIASLEAHVWLESTLLVRSLRATVAEGGDDGDGDRPATGPGPA